MLMLGCFFLAGCDCDGTTDIFMENDWGGDGGQVTGDGIVEDIPIVPTDGLANDLLLNDAPIKSDVPSPTDQMMNDTTILDVPISPTDGAFPESGALDIPYSNDI